MYWNKYESMFKRKRKKLDWCSSSHVSAQDLVYFIKVIIIIIIIKPKIVKDEKKNRASIYLMINRREKKHINDAYVIKLLLNFFLSFVLK